MAFHLYFYIPMSLSPERNAGIAKDKKSREELQKDAIKKAYERYYTVIDNFKTKNNL